MIYQKKMSESVQNLPLASLLYGFLSICIQHRVPTDRLDTSVFEAAGMVVRHDAARSCCEDQKHPALRPSRRSRSRRGLAQRSCSVDGLCVARMRSRRGDSACMSSFSPHGCRRGPHDAPISGATSRGPSPALRYLLYTSTDVLGALRTCSYGDVGTMHDEVGSETALGRNMAISTAVSAGSRSLLPVPVRCCCCCSVSLPWRSRRSSVCLSSPHGARLHSRRARLCSRSLRCRWMLRAQSIARPSPRPVPLTVEVVHWSSVHSGPSSAPQ